MADQTLAGYKTQRRNANAHTARGYKELDASIREDGWIGAMTVAADGETFDGSARLEKAADIYGVDVEPLVVHTTGERPVIVVRDDIPNTDDKRAQRLSLRANRVAELDLSFDVEVLASFDADVLEGLWSPYELSQLGVEWAGEADKPEDHWQGMPEFEQKDKTGFHSIIVHFETAEDMQGFAELIQQPLTEKSNRVWFPEREKRALKSIAFNDEF